MAYKKNIYTFSLKNYSEGGVMFRLRCLAIFLTLISLSLGNLVFGQSSTAYQINREHTGNTVLLQPLTFPLIKKWEQSFPDVLSYPIIADGQVFVLSRSIAGSYGSILYALDALTGNVLWQQNVPGTFYWSAHTYGDGRLYVLNYNGLLKAFDSATGALIWSTQMPIQYAFSSAPTFSNGYVYLGGGRQWRNCICC